MSILVAVITLAIISLLFGILLGYTSVKFHVEGDPIVDKIDALLPQTQCGQCTFPGCRPYAEAIGSGEANINQCPPGGEVTMLALSELLGVEPVALDEELASDPEKTVVYVDEQTCIGCTLCIQACPVDAILGAAKQMHTIIEAECTGCDLCIPPCPVDCIHIKTVKPELDTWRWSLPESDDTTPKA
ncbi:MAG: electron transport complex subunit RsxB [endosymbiont of Galathealinum brachiosum]|uniref:Ion-translocating oxidoreductase complex subunit B n=1 Tax=endosymbiont of Galathealinum brachiosum TaxID=2200906 RepID=A0A370D9E7_9GAMM|nr:MAG: electron transport complex subunit RsxB [endosymbiont of Galathealinum brachiosum]